MNVALSVVDCAAIVEFFRFADTWNLTGRLSSRVAQWERGSEDQNLALLSLLLGS